MNSRCRDHQRDPRARRGYISLLFVGALLVVLGAGALVVDRMWLDNASVELQAAADASALAAARVIAGDETLREDVDWERIVGRAMDEAQWAADLNPVAGGKLVLRPGAEGDVWFGRDVLNRETGQTRFVFTDYAPTKVRVRAERTEDTSNPVRMMMGGIFGVHEANVSTFGAVVVDNHVLGVRPHEQYPVPALPFAILAGDVDTPSEEDDDNAAEADEREDDRETDAPSTDGSDEKPADDQAGDESQSIVPEGESWATAIDARNGRDELGWDGLNNELVRQPDGIPEIVVRPLRQIGEKEDAERANVQLLDFQSGFEFDVLDRQIENGLTPDDFEEFDGEMLLDGRHHRMRCSARVDDRVFEMLERSIGKPRLCFLYDHHAVNDRFGDGELDVTRLVAVRVLEIRTGDDGSTEIVLQPTVVVTKTAIPFEDWQWSPKAGPDENGFRNPYVYRMTVTK